MLPLPANIPSSIVGSSSTDGDGELSLKEFKIIMRAGPIAGAVVDKVRQAMTDPDEMMVMLRNAREDLEEVRRGPLEPAQRPGSIADSDRALFPLCPSLQY